MKVSIVSLKFWLGPTQHFSIELIENRLELMLMITLNYYF